MTAPLTVFASVINQDRIVLQAEDGAILSELSDSLIPGGESPGFFKSFGSFAIMADGTIWALVANDNDVFDDLYDALYHLDPIAGTVLESSATDHSIAWPGRPEHNSLAAHPSGDLIIAFESALVRMNPTTGGTVKTYSVWPAGDFALNAAGTVLLYADGETLKRWDLVNDVALADFATLADSVRLVNWLSDGTVVCAVDNDTPEFDIVRVQDGVGVITTYPTPGFTEYSHQFPKGLGASVLLNRVWATAVRDEETECDDEMAIVRAWDLTTGEVTDDTHYCEDISSNNYGQLVLFPAGCCEAPNESDDPILALIPEIKDTTTHNAALETVATIPVVVESDAGVTVSPSLGGDVWVVYDQNDETDAMLKTIIREALITVADGLPATQIIRSIQMSGGVRLAELAGCHSFWQTGPCTFLTVNRDTHALIEVTAGSIGSDYENLFGVVSKTYSLTPNPLDGWPNADGTRLIYVGPDGKSLWLYDLEEDAVIRKIASFSKGIAWPVWLRDDTIIGVTNWGGGPSPYLLSADVTRIDLDGNVLSPAPYTYDRSIQLAGGLYGLTAVFGGPVCDEGAGKIYLAGRMTDTQPGIMGIDLLLGTVDTPVATPIPDAFFGVASGFCAVGTAAASTSSGGDGSGSDQGLPDKPDVHCGPVNNLRSPAPNPGCNGGGVGFVPEYTGPSGSVPVAPDPDPPETLLGETQITIEAEATHTRYDANGDTIGTETRRWAVVELDDQYRKKGCIESLGEVRHGVADNQGNMRATEIEIHLNDSVDREFAIAQAGATTRYSQRDEIKVFARSARGRRENLQPVPICRGLLTAESYGSDEVARIVATDGFFTDGGAFSPDRRIPAWPFPLTFYTRAPKDLAAVMMPIIGGNKTDNGAKDPLTGLLSERGVNPARFVGMMGLDGSDSDVWGRFNACLYAIYKITGLYGSDLGGMGLYGEGLTSDGKAKSTLGLGGTFDLSAVPTNGYAEITVFTDRGQNKIRIIGKGANRVKVDSKVDQADIATASWYISRIDYLPRRVKIDLMTRNGVDVDVPGWAGYSRPTSFEDFSCEEGDFRVTDFGVRGPLLQAHLIGEVTLAFNAIGIEDQGDGSGLPIIDLFTFKNWAIDNVVHFQKPKPSIEVSPGVFKWPQSAADLPAFDDGITKTKSSSFALAQEISRRHYGGYGLRVSCWLGDATSTRDLLQLFNDNSGARTLIDEDGRVSEYLRDEDADTSTWPRVEHVSRVFGEVTRTRAHDEILNVMRGGCDWDADAGQFRDELSPPLKSTAAIKRNKGVELPSKHYDGKLVANRAHFEELLQLKLDANADGPVYVSINHGDVWLLNLPIGSGFLFTSIVGPGALGYRDRPLIILDRVYHIDDGTVSLTCLEAGEDMIDGVDLDEHPFRFVDDDDEAPVFTDDDDEAPRFAA